MGTTAPAGLTASVRYCRCSRGCARPVFLSSIFADGVVSGPSMIWKSLSSAVSSLLCFSFSLPLPFGDACSVEAAAATVDCDADDSPI